MGSRSALAVLAVSMLILGACGEDAASSTTTTTVIETTTSSIATTTSTTAATTTSAPATTTTPAYQICRESRSTSVRRQATPSPWSGSPTTMF